MAQEFSRARRVAEQIRRELAELIRSEGNDPRLNMVSITDIDISRDLAVAKVYVTLLGEPQGREPVLKELNRLAPALRGQLGRRMHIRSAPSLNFIYDEVPERGAELSELIERTVAADAARRTPDDDNAL